MRKIPGFSIGMPTEIDVTRMVTTFGVPEVGATISYIDVEQALRLTRLQARFWTVTTAWRKKLEREQNLVTEAVPNEGFHVLTNRERVGHTARRLKQHLRGTGVAGRRAASTSRDGLSHEDVRSLDFVANIAGQFKVQAAIEARKLRAVPALAPSKG